MARPIYQVTPRLCVSSSYWRGAIGLRLGLGGMDRRRRGDGKYRNHPIAPPRGPETAPVAFSGLRTYQRPAATKNAAAALYGVPISHSKKPRRNNQPACTYTPAHQTRPASGTSQPYFTLIFFKAFKSISLERYGSTHDSFTRSRLRVATCTYARARKTFE